jgi:hypothetical protein
MSCRDTRHWIGDEGKAVGFIVADGFAVLASGLGVL